MHEHDEDAVKGWDPEDQPRSVVSGRTNEEVKADPHRRWHSERAAAQASEEVGPRQERCATTSSLRWTT